MGGATRASGTAAPSALPWRLEQALRRRTPWPSSERMECLQALALDCEGLGVELQWLPLVLQQTPQLTSLDLSNNELGPDWARALGEAIFATCNNLEQTQLTELTLQFCRLSNIAGLAAAVDCTNNTGSAGLSSLNLGGNRLGPKALQDLSRVLKQAPNLSRLVLERNPLGPQGAFVLATLLKLTPCLTILRVGECRFGPDGVMDLGEGLLHVRRLQELGLECNNVRPEGANALVEAFQHLPELTELDVSWNKLGQKGVRAIALALRYCRKMNRLVVSSNGLDPAAEREICQGIRQIATGVIEPTRALLGV